MVSVGGERVRFQNDEDIILPTAFQKSLDLREGDRLVVWQDESGVHLQNRRLAIERAQSVMKEIYKPGRSAVRELLAERRANTLREEQGG